MAGVEFDGVASREVFDNTSAGLRMGVPNPYGTPLPAAGGPSSEQMLQAARARTQDLYSMVSAPAAQPEPAYVGYNIDSGQLWSNGRIYDGRDVTSLLKAQAAGDLAGSQQPIPQGFARARPEQFEAMIANTPDWQKEAKASVRNYGAGFAAIGAAMGSDTARQKFEQLSGEADLLSRSSSAPKDFDEVKFGENALAYVRRLGIDSVPYLAELAAAYFTAGAIPAAKTAGTAAAKQFAEKAIRNEATRIIATNAGRITEEQALAQAATTVGKRIAGSAGAVAGSYPSSLGDVLTNQYDQSGGQFDLPSAAMAAVPYAGLNLVGLGGMLTGVHRLAGTGAIKHRVARGTATFGLTMAGEALNETGQEVTNQLGRMAVDPNASLTSPDALHRYKESAIGGALLGGVAGAPHGVHAAITPVDMTPTELTQKARERLAGWQKEDTDKYLGDFMGRVNSAPQDTLPGVSPITSLYQNAFPSGTNLNLFGFQPEAPGPVFDENLPPLNPTQVPADFVTAMRQYDLTLPMPATEAEQKQRQATAEALGQQVAAQGFGTVQHESQGELPLEQTRNKAGWRGSARIAFSEAGGTGKKIEQALSLGSPEQAAQKLRYLAEVAKSTKQAEAFDAAHKSLLGVSIEEFPTTNRLQNVREQLLGALLPKQKDELARILGLGRYEKQPSDVTIAATAGVTKSAVGKWYNSIADRLKPVVERLGITREEAEQALGIDRTVTTDATEEQLAELTNSGSISEDGEAAEVAQNQLHTNATLGVKQGTAVGKAMYKHVAGENGRAWDELSTLEKTYIADLVRSIGLDDTGTVRPQAKAAIEAIAQNPVGELKPEPPTAPDFDVTHAATAALDAPENQSIRAAWTSAHRRDDGSRITHDFFEQWHDGGGVTPDVGSQYDAHGIAKGNPLGALLNILSNGINRSRRFDTAPLVQSAGNEAGAGAGLGTAGGAYKDGPFILLGARGKELSHGIHTVLVADGVANVIPQLQAKFPAIRFVKYSEAQSTLSSDSSAAQVAAPEPPTPIKDANAITDFVETNQDLMENPENTLLERVAEKLSHVKVPDRMDIGTELDLSIEEWDAVGVPGDPAWNELTIDEQVAWVTNFVRWKLDQAALEPHQFKANLVENRDGQERSKPAAQEGAGKAVARKAAPAKGVQGEAAGSEKEKPGEYAVAAPMVRPEREAGPVTVTKGKKAQKLVRKREGAGAGMPVAEVKAAAEEATSGMKNAPEVRVVASHEDSNGVLEKGDKGAFAVLADGSTVVYINAAEAESAADVMATVFHEVLGHYGLSAKFGAELEKLLNSIYYGNKEVRAAANAWLKVHGLEGTAENRALATEEVLSEGAVTSEASLMDKVKRLLGRFLRMMGWSKTFSNGEVRAILQEAADQVYSGTADRSGERTAEVRKRDAEVTTADEFVPKDTVKGRFTNILGHLRRAGVSLRELAQIKREFGSDLTRTKDGKEEGLGPLEELIRLSGSYSKEVLDMARGTIDKVVALDETARNKLSHLLNQASLNGFVLSEPDTSARNGWMLSDLKDAEGEALDEAKAVHDRFKALRAEYNAAGKEVSDLYAAVDALTEKLLQLEFGTRTKFIIDSYLTELKAKVDGKTKAEIEKISFDDLTPATFTPQRNKLKALFKGNAEAEKAIRDMSAEVHTRMEGFHQRRGTYVPLMRFGDWVVVARSNDFVEQQKVVDASKAEMDALKRKSPEMVEYMKLADAAAEARASAHKSGSKVSYEAAAEARKAMKEFRNTKEFKDFKEELGKVAREYKKEYRTLVRMAKDSKHFNVHKEEREDFAKQRADNYVANGFSKENVYHKPADTWIGGIDSVSTSFANKLIDRINRSYEGDSDHDKAMRKRNEQAVKRIFVETQHENSSLHRMAMRRNISGYNKDISRVLQSFMLQSAHRLSAQKFFIPIQEQLDAVREIAADKDKAGSTKLTEVANELAIRRHMDLSYEETPIQDSVTRFTQAWVLGASPAYLLQQLGQTFMLSVPHLSGRSSVGAATKAMWKGVRDAVSLIRESGKGSGLMNRFEIKLDSELLPENEQKALKYVADLGQLDILMDHDISLGARGKETGKYDRMIEMTNWMARQIETTNRISTALAAYRLETARLKKEGKLTAEQIHDEAKKYAAESVEQTQVDYSNENAARWMKRNAFAGSKLIMQFKKYQVHMIQMLLWNSKKALAGDKEAQRIMTGILTTHMLMAGSLGLPIAAPIFAVAQMAAWLGADDDEVNPEVAYKNFLADMIGKDAADAFVRGLPAALGADMSKRLGLGNVFSPVPFVRSDKQGKEQFDAMVLAYLGPSMSTGGRLVDGLSALSDGKFVDAWSKMLPKYLADPMKAYKVSEEGVTTKQGNVRIPADNLSVADVIMIGMGVPSLKVNKYYEYNTAFEDQKAAATRVASELKKQWAKGDDRPGTREAIDEFNERHPSMRITPKDLFAAQKETVRYAKGVTEDGLKVGKRDKEFAENLRF